MADVFISYKKTDRGYAERVDKALQAAGYTTWWDTSLVAGDSWSEAIRAELRAARCVVVLWSKASWDSRWVHAEAQDGFERNILVAARLDDVCLEAPYNLLQTADLRSAAGLAVAVEGVARKIGPPANRTTTPSAKSGTLETPEVSIGGLRIPRFRVEVGGGNGAGGQKVHANAAPKGSTESKRGLPLKALGLAAALAALGWTGWYGFNAVAFGWWDIIPSAEITAAGRSAGITAVQFGGDIGGRTYSPSEPAEPREAQGEIGFKLAAEGDIIRVRRRAQNQPWGDSNDVSRILPRATVLRAVLSPDRRTLATFSTDLNVALWDIETGALLRSKYVGAAPNQLLNVRGVPAQNQWQRTDATFVAEANLFVNQGPNGGPDVYSGAGARLSFSPSGEALYFNVPAPPRPADAPSDGYHSTDDVIYVLEVRDLSGVELGQDIVFSPRSGRVPIMQLVQRQSGAVPEVRLFHPETGALLKTIAMPADPGGGFDGQPSFSIDGRTLELFRSFSFDGDAGSGRQIYTWDIDPISNAFGARLGAIERLKYCGDPKLAPAPSNQGALWLVTLSDDGQRLAIRDARSLKTLVEVKRGGIMGAPCDRVTSVDFHERGLMIYPTVDLPFFDERSLQVLQTLPTAPPAPPVPG